MKTDPGYEPYFEDHAPEKNELNNYCRIGFWLSILSLLISARGIIPLIAVIVTFIGLTKTNTNDLKGKAYAFLGLIIGFVSLAYSYFQL